MFVRMDSDWYVLSRTVLVGRQITLPGALYRQLEALVTVQHGITEAEFIRMCQTLLLKRVQDVYERERNVRPEYYVRLARTIIMSAPWAKLLYSLGAYHSGACGIFLHIVQPPRPTEPEPWWTVDPTLVMKWNREMGRLQHLYLMREYPSPNDWQHKTIVMTPPFDNKDDGTRTIKSYTNEPQMTDAFLRFVNDELFDYPDLTYICIYM
ncbi:hypothetical protein RUM43_011588 [Polyplax serrata]|uniref:Uncharacterized protein n=1 Tax=Polyplax serrata TaxID=468196 RepID=A0AAN8P956_POLSC